jgi:hypothetical protein
LQELSNENSLVVVKFSLLLYIYIYIYILKINVNLSTIHLLCIRLGRGVETFCRTPHMVIANVVSKTYVDGSLSVKKSKSGCAQLSLLASSR